jgi:hypothetical protein
MKTSTGYLPAAELVVAMIDYCRRSFEPRSWPLVDEAEPHRGPLSKLLLAVQLTRKAAVFFLPNRKVVSEMSFRPLLN